MLGLLLLEESIDGSLDIPVIILKHLCCKFEVLNVRELAEVECFLNLLGIEFVHESEALNIFIFKSFLNSIVIFL